MRVLVNAEGQTQAARAGDLVGIRALDCDGAEVWAQLADVTEEVTSATGAPRRVLRGCGAAEGAGGAVGAEEEPRALVARLRAAQGEADRLKSLVEELQAEGEGRQAARGRAEVILAALPEGKGLVPLELGEGQAAPLVRWCCRAFWGVAWALQATHTVMLGGHLSPVLSGLAAAGLICSVMDSYVREARVRKAWRPVVVEGGRYRVREGAAGLEVACRRGEEASWRPVGSFVVVEGEAAGGEG